MDEKRNDAFSPSGTSPQDGRPAYGQPYTPPQGEQPNGPAAPYGQPNAPSSYGQPYAPQGGQPYGQPYGQQTPYGQQAPYGQQNGQLNGQPYPMPNSGLNPSFLPPTQKKKHSTGKIVLIVVACIVAFNIIVFGGIFAAFLLRSPENLYEKYQQSGVFADLIDACDAYDNQIALLDDTQIAEQCFAEALADTKAFLRAFPEAGCVDYYEDANAAYNVLMADYLYLMLQNGNYDSYIEVFKTKMLEVAPTDQYYMDSYTFMDYVESGIFEFDDTQKAVILQGFDALLEASTSENEREMNLKEYYDCCETLGMYDKADALAELLESENANTAA